MKLKAQLNNNEHNVSLNFNGDAIEAMVNERSYQLEVRQESDGAYLLVEGNSVYRCRVEKQRGSQETYAVSVRGNRYDVRIIDPKRLRSGQGAGVHEHGSADIVSSMPGKVVRVLVKAGDPVEAGAGIIVVEAMKMQNEMKAPKAGTVISINFAAGATVNAGDVLAVIE